mmetsp:Transcript_21077/g.45714  ORF Transcript_21077/g.45714 Transcript_21077/m.45714 type:complete len:116 (+) Transcript_21077:358-705(+)
MSSTDFWFVCFVDGLECAPCKSAKTNTMRLSAGLVGKAKVGIVNCDADDETRMMCTHKGVPPQPHAPEIRVFRRGKKQEDDQGEVLYNPNDIEPHIAMQISERLVRCAQLVVCCE